ncbi:MAG: tetratricopeptide repeat protein [Parazoarcus communis]
MYAKGARVRAAWVVALALPFFVACASKPAQLSEAEFLRWVEGAEPRVERLLELGQREQALQVLSEGLELQPASKTPWLRIARIQFDGGNYGAAIVAADEVLTRDPADRTALSLRAVAGLRVATEAIVRLRGDSSFSGTAREDAVNLAKVLRETLGEDVLVPAVATPSRPRRNTSATAARSPERAGGRQERSQVAPATGTGNPFSVLK